MHQRLRARRSRRLAAVMLAATAIASSGCAPAEAEGDAATVDAESRSSEVRQVRRGIDAVDTARDLTSEFNVRSADAMSVLEPR